MRPALARNDAPSVTIFGKFIAEVLNPDGEDPFAPRRLDNANDVDDHRVPVVSLFDDLVQGIDDEERGFRLALERNRGLIPIIRRGRRPTQPSGYSAVIVVGAARAPRSSRPGRAPVASPPR